MAMLNEFADNKETTTCKRRGCKLMDAGKVLEREREREREGGRE
jgi:hypothetical protein